jgi:integrase
MSPEARQYIRPLPPVEVEAIRTRLLSGEHGRRDVALLGLIAYAGLRPQEARGLQWGDVDERIVRVERAASGRRVKSTKNEKLRTVRLLAPLADDLAAWRREHPDSSEEGWVFPTTGGGM